jgi:hypothetical protein
MALIATVLAVSASASLSATAAAQSEGPGWEVTARNFPTNLAPGHVGGIRIEVFNVGAGSSAGTVTVTDTLPHGVTAVAAGDGFALHEPETFEIKNDRWVCTGNGPSEPPHVAGATVVTCTNGADEPSLIGGAGMGVQTDLLAIKVRVAEDAREDPQDPEANRVTVAGGGAPTPASTTDPITISSNPAPFGFTGFDVWFSNADGTLDTQAGSHPYAATFSFALTTDLEKNGEANGGGNIARNIEVELPPGFVGDPTAVPQCSRQDFIGERCPRASEVGIIDVETFFDLGFQVFNLVPPPGVPAEFGFHYLGVATYIDTAVRSGSDYGITSRVPNAPQRETHNSVLILWGNPEAASHDRWRGFNFAGEPCSEEDILQAGTACSKVQNPAPKPFLTLPTACAGPGKFTIRANSWEHPELGTIEKSFLWHDSNDNPTGLTGCEHLGFAPTLTAAPDTSSADTPAGLTVEVKPPVGGLSEPEGLSTSDIQNTTVTLPQGVAINPGQAAGLQACPETEETLKRNDEAPVCPNASKVGTDEIFTPLLSKPLQGNVYVLQGNPPELKLLVEASGQGVNLKLVGTVHLDEQSGQLVTTFADTPELPFTNFKLSFSGGAQAALVTPTRCGTYAATSDFNPWAGPFVADVFPTGEFAITSGTGGAPCPPSPLPYTPQMIAGATTDQAGGYTDFSLLLQVPDDQQRTSGLQFKTPEGLLGMISKVSLCGEPQAAQGTCSAASQIGHTVVASGPGPYPLVVPQAGQPPAPIYLTGPYEGAPYGLSIVVPVHVGPFTLPTQVVRAKIEVDPITTQLTVTTNPLPQFIGGVPTDLRTIDAVIDRPGFMFNPTGCSPRSFSGSAFGTEGAQAPIESHFQMGSCRALLFKPDFKVFTSGRTSRANGASLGVKIVYPTGNLGANQASSQANIQSVKVELPKRLPSRLTTLQKACTAAQFNANPAGCPAASVVGHATATTPVLPVPLSGPAYFVSNGSEAFPNLIIVLQGYGVTVHLVGNTFISKAGITSSTFKQVPDVPIQSFELNLPEGPFSALAANGKLCKSTLVMPTEFIAQNGATLDEKTKIAVTGCPKGKKAMRKEQASGKKRAKGGKAKRKPGQRK